MMLMSNDDYDDQPMERELLPSYLKDAGKQNSKGLSALMIMCQYMFRCDESMTLNPNYCVFQDLMQVEGGLVSKEGKTALNYLCSGLTSYCYNTYEECDKQQ